MFADQYFYMYVFDTHHWAKH